MYKKNTFKSKLNGQLKVTTVLKDLGYEVDPDDEEDQQFGCNLHGGEDSHPSARVYPSTNSWYCFACKKTRDVVSTVCDVNNVDFKTALKYLFDVYAIKIEKDIKEDEEEHDEGKIMLTNLDSFLLLLTKARKLDKDKTVRIWSIFDNMSQQYSHKKINLTALENLILKLKSKITL